MGHPSGAASGQDVQYPLPFLLGAGATSYKAGEVASGAGSGKKIEVQRSCLGAGAAEAAPFQDEVATEKRCAVLCGTQCAAGLAAHDHIIKPFPLGDVLF